MKKAIKAPSQKKDTTFMTMSQLSQQEKGQGCSATVYTYLAGSDEHERHHGNSQTVGHALIRETASGELEAMQYPLQQSSDSKTAIVCEMTEIRKVMGNRNTWFRAKDSLGNKYISRRSVMLQSDILGDDPAEMRYFSPYEYDSSSADECSDEESVALFREDLAAEERDMLAQISHVTKSSVIDVVAGSVRQRDENPKRDGSQNEIMGQSARDAYEDFFKRMKDFLSPKLVLILKRAYQANLFSAPENEFRPEWLHKIAHSLMPISDRPEYNPQQKSNLGAAGKWANTEMMLLERIAKWFAVSEEDAKITLSSFFEMLLDSELIRSIHFEVTVEIDRRFIRFIQEIDVLKEYPTFRKTSDLAQMVAISDAIFHDKPPIRRDRVELIFKKYNTESNPAASEVAMHGLTEPFHADASEEEIKAFHTLSSHPDFSVCKRIQNVFPFIDPDEPYSIASIIDLETSGLDASEKEIIEIAIVSFAYSKSKGILGIVGTYESLNEPKVALSSEITHITGITNEQLRGQVIEWERVHEIIDRSKYIICHNAKFDGAFLAQQTPELIQNKVRTIPFACTLEDINWFARGYDPRKLDYLNFKLGYFYEAHRALSDCWATLNLLYNVPGAFDELLYNAHKKRMYFFSNPLVCHKYDTPLVPAEISMHENVVISEEIDQAYALLSTLPQYKIYRAVPQPLAAQGFIPTQPIITIIDLKTTGSNPVTDDITEIGVLSFTKDDSEFVIIDTFRCVATAEHAIQWDAMAAILHRTNYLIGHKSALNRKFLESRTPCEIQRRIRDLPFASTDQDINWKNWKASNTSLKYLSYMFGFFFQPDCIVSQGYATLNLLRVVPDAWAELMQSFDKKQTIFLVNGPFCYAIREDLKRKGFQWSTGTGNMGKGWWTSIDDEEKTEVLQWLSEAKDQAQGKNDIYFKPITPLDRYSIRAEFKAAEMRTLAGQTASRKRPKENEIANESYKRVCK